MPRASKLKAPPETMTWIGAAPVLVTAVIFDIIRFMCEMLWFFGPALAALYCTAQVTDKVGSLAGASAAVCGAAATAVGVYGAPAIAALGVVLAMAVGLMGWLIIGILILKGNPRLFKGTNTLWFGGSLLVSEVPFIGSLPAFTATMLKLHRTQIKEETAALKEYTKAHAAEIQQEQQERQQQAAQLLQEQNIQIAQAENQQAADNAQYEEQMAEQEEQKATDEAETMEEEESTPIPDNVISFPSNRVRNAPPTEKTAEQLRKAA